ncbi:MAG: ATP cone domain-containing protein, partial [Candidatus Bathyarchaeia archaeon]
MITVVKRDGRREEFIPEKIVVSCLKSGASLDSARKIAKIVEGRILDRGLTEISARELT